MRNFNKFLFKDKFHIYPFFLKKRILNFNRPKWKKIQIQILNYLKFYSKLKKKIRSTFLLSFIFNLIFIKKKLNNIFFLKKKYIRLKFFVFFKNLKKFLFSNKYNQFLLKFNLKEKKSKIKKFKIKSSSFLFRFFFFNFKILKKNYKIKIRSKFIFKNLLLMKHNIIKYFFGLITLKNFKNFFFNNFKLSNYTNLISELLLKFEFRLDILLWRLKFFFSPYLARFACKKNLVNLNFNMFNKNISFFFKKKLISGDFISCNFHFSFKKNLKSYVKFFFIPSIFEIDYYSGNIILLKNFNTLQFKEINSFLKQPFCVYKFKDYLLK